MIELEREETTIETVRLESVCLERETGKYGIRYRIILGEQRMLFNDLNYRRLLNLQQELQP